MDASTEVSFDLDFLITSTTLSIELIKVHESFRARELKD